MSQASGIIKSFFWKASERLMVQGLGLVVQIILARLLMPEDFASLAIITAIVNYLGLFVQSGLSVAVVQKKDLSKTDVDTLTSISLFAATILFIALFFAAPKISNFYNVGDLVWPIRVMGISLFLFAFNSIQTGLLQRKMRFRTIFIRSLLATPLSAIIGIGMAYLGYGIWSLIAYTLSNILILVIFMNMMPDLRLHLGFSLKSAKELYSFSIKIMGTSIVSAGGDTVRTLAIGKFYNPSQLAYFDRGLNYSSLVTQVVNTSLSSVLLPVMSRSQENISYIKDVTRKSVGMSAFIMTPILVMVAIMAKPLVLIVLSEKWMPCAFYLSLFCLLRIPGVITSCDKQTYYALGKSQIGLYFEVLLLITNLISLFALIPLGIKAVAIGFTIIEYLSNVCLFFVSNRVFGYSLLERSRDLAKPFINAALMALFAISLTFVFENIWLLIIAQLTTCAVTYVLLAILTHDSNFSFIKNKINL